MRMPRTVLATVVPLLLASLLTSAPAMALQRGIHPRGVRAPAKVLTVIEENHSFAQEQSGMPYLWSLAQKYGYASNYHGVSHPSLPNYLAIAGGSTFGITDDNYPSAHRVPRPDIYNQAIRAGRTAAAYSESMPSRCDMTNAKPYAVRHNPWPYFLQGRARRCNAFDQPARALHPNHLPNVATLTPNLLHDAHDGTLAQADAYLKHRLPAIFASADFQSGALAVVITADENGGGSANILTVVCDVHLHGIVVTTALNHYSLNRFYSQTVRAAPMRKGKTATNMRAAFGL
jgi:hypothetical protein